MFIASQITLTSSVQSLSLTKTSFEKIYRDEEDVKTKERMLLVLNVVYQGNISAHMQPETFTGVKLGPVNG